MFARVLSLALLSLPAIAAEVRAPKTFTEGTVWIAFDITAESLPGGAHGGWDLFHGAEKQLWIGSGWRIGGSDNRQLWGLWSATDKTHHFEAPVEVGKATRLVARIDFGKTEPGDESVALWIGEPEPGKAIARLEGVTLTGADRARSFVAKGGRYQLGEPAFARAREDLQDAKEGEQLFVETIHPLLVAKCLACHGEDEEKIKGELDLRSLESTLAGGESGIVTLVPGKPEESLLYLAAAWKDPDFEMPPKENDRLDEKQLASLRRWIELGAPWPEIEASESPATEISQADLGRWSEPDAEGRVRVVTSGGLNSAWTERPYEEEAVWAFRPRAEVDSPTPDKHPIDAFLDKALADSGLEPAPRASDRDLRRRLAYALTGLPPDPADADLALDRTIDKLLASPHFGERMAQHWLDVVRYADSNGFSRDEERPDAHAYRSYVIESLNADKPFDRFVREQIAGDELGLAGQEALAFLWMGPWEITNMTSAAVARQMWLDDVVNSIGVTFLGHELRCAKCHDHKFDPIPTRDYYALQAVFGATRHHLKNGTFKIQPQKATPVSILKGGVLDSPTDPVKPGLLSAITTARDHPVPTAPEGRRAALAHWIADPANPLTARVLVNRVWQWHFGHGLVATPNGLGVMGSRPTHPELLDWLANHFVEDGWSIKRLCKLIVTSEAFQRGTRHPEPERLAETDPDGTLLAAFRPRRLTAEEIRDSMLAASGELDRRVGGPGFRAEINWEVAFQPRLAMGKIVAPWEPDPSRSDRNRRSLYAMRIRNLGHPLLEVLNRPGSELSCERRDETTVVTQTFSLFHSDFSNARALALAHRCATEAPNDAAAQIGRVFYHLFGRSPTPPEAERCLAHLRRMVEHHESHEPVRTELPTRVTLSTVVEKTGKPAHQTFELKRMKNYERDLQPWEVGAPTRALAELCLVLLNSSEFLHVY